MPLNLQNTLSEVYSKAEVPATVRRTSHEDSDEDGGANTKGKAGNHRKGKSKSVKGKSVKGGSVKGKSVKKCKDGNSGEKGKTKNDKGKSSKGASDMNQNGKKVSKTVAALSGGPCQTRAATKNLNAKGASNIRAKKRARIDRYSEARTIYVEHFSGPAGTAANCWLKSPERLAVLADMSSSEKKRRRFADLGA